MNPYAKVMARAVIDDDSVALAALLDEVMTHGYERQPKTYWFYLLRSTGGGPDVYLNVPPSIEVIDLDWLVKAVTLYQVAMMSGSYHMVRSMEGVLFLPEFIPMYEMRDVLKNIASSILDEYLRVLKADVIQNESDIKLILAEQVKRTGKK